MISRSAIFLFFIIASSTVALPAKADDWKKPGLGDFGPLPGYTKPLECSQKGGGKNGGKHVIIEKELNIDGKKMIKELYIPLE